MDKWSVKSSTINGEFISTGICCEGGTRLLSIPLHVQLFQNYPNPLSKREGSTITFSISNNPSSSKKLYQVDLKIFDVYGRLITTLVHNEFPSGEYKFRINQNTLSEGIYIYQPRVDKSFITK